LHVFVTETRPMLQGARLTAYELRQLGIPYTLLSDMAAGLLLKRAGVDKAIVGGDRVLPDGHLFNKVGTYVLALLFKEHRRPFFCAVPTSSIDPRATIRDVKIEERSPQEVLSIGGRYIAPRDAKVYNPAFDVTPPQLISAYITERGILYPPFEASLGALIGTPEGPPRPAGSGT